MQITRLVIDDKEYNGFPLSAPVVQPPSPPPALEGFPIMIRHYHEVFFHPTTGEGLSYIAQKMIYDGWKWAPGDPAAVPFVQEAKVPPVRISPAMEHFIFNLIKESANGAMTDKQLRNVYANLLRGDKCYNNKASYLEGYQSVILNENVGAEEMKLTGVLTTGAMGWALGDEMTVGGKRVYKILALNSKDVGSWIEKQGSQWVNKKSFYDDIWCIHAATNSVTAPKEDPYHPGKVDPWPGLGDIHKSTPFPIFGNGRNYVYVESKWVKRLPLDTNTRLNPYYMSSYGEVDY